MCPMSYIVSQRTAPDQSAHMHSRIDTVPLLAMYCKSEMYRVVLGAGHGDRGQSIRKTLVMSHVTLDINSMLWISIRWAVVCQVFH